MLKTINQSEEQKTYYITCKIDARFIAEVKAKSLHEAMLLANNAYLNADFGSATDIDGKPIIAEDEDGNYVWEK